MNVADDLTKGISAKDANGRLFNGPDFLRSPESIWPMEASVPDKKDIDKERKVEIVCPVAFARPISDPKSPPSGNRPIDKPRIGDS